MVISAIRSACSTAYSKLSGLQSQTRAYGAPTRESISTAATSTSSIRTRCRALSTLPRAVTGVVVMRPG